MTTHGFHVYWGVWAIVLFVSFIVPEVIGLVRNKAWTLSETLWRIEEMAPGQSVFKWQAAHFLIGGMLIVLLVWLLGHLVFGLWR